MPLPRAAERRALAIAALLAAAAALVRLPGLGFPDVRYFDEIYHARTALDYLAGRPATDWVHPPTAKLLIAASVWALGDDGWGWRLAPALAGIALAPLFFLMARRATGAERPALLASLLLLADGVYLVHSRVAMTNVFAVLFQTGAALAVLRAAAAERLRARDMALVGVWLGLAISTRWTSFLAAAFLALVLAGLRRERLLRPRELAVSALGFAVVPLAIYAASYAPWLAQRHGLGSVTGLGACLQELWPEQLRIWRYHAELSAEHPYFSPWYTWPWLVRPAWYYFDVAAGGVRGIIALGNPLIWWASLPVTAWAFATGLRRADQQLLFAAGGFCALYLPWALSPRTLNFSHYLFEAIPYACLALGLLLDAGWDRPRTGSVCRSYLAAVLMAFALFLPLWTALPVPRQLFFDPVAGLRLWTWLPGWS